MEILIWMLFGIMSGWIASVITGAASKESIFKNLLLGILGALTGSLAVNLLGETGAVSPNSTSITIVTITSGLIIWFGGFLSSINQNVRKEQRAWQ